MKRKTKVKCILGADIRSRGRDNALKNGVIVEILLGMNGNVGYTAFFQHNMQSIALPESETVTKENEKRFDIEVDYLPGDIVEDAGIDLKGRVYSVKVAEKGVILEIVTKKLVYTLLANKYLKVIEQANEDN